ncbi:replication initiation protein [Spiroplasma endosymbiont of Nebria brevicollis]|uniref:replication initiation protein n=1 Tax=Spiroplasma endosymbiont of Nebria brevicollis TaxID=3066284 RepID=UPI00313ACEDD
MANSFVNKKDNKFIKKSNIIVRTVTNQSAGIMTQRLFNFLIKTVQEQNSDDIKGNKNKIHFFAVDFCKYFAINQNALYNPIIYKGKETTVLKKEIDELTSLKFEFLDESNNKYDLINLFNSGGYHNGIIYVEPNTNIFKKHCIDLKRDYINIFLPYTKEVTSKYSLRLYEYLRSYLYMNAKTKGTPTYQHIWDFQQLAKILNLSLNSSYFKYISKLQKNILEAVKKDLLKTDIIFTYDFIKVGRKYNKIILNTHLDLEKFNAQNPELEKAPTKKEYVKKEKSLPLFTNKIEKPKIIEKSILTDEELKKIMQDFDNH